MAPTPGAARGPSLRVPVLCLHGLGRSPADWAAVGPALETFRPVRAPALPRDRVGALEAARAALTDEAVVVGHSIGAVIALRLAAERADAVRAVVLTGCFFPPARNGRSLATSVAGYARHRVAFVREALIAPAAPRPRRGTGGTLRQLAGYGVRPERFDRLADAVRAPVLVVHARDDHHVPVDFALAAAARRRAWTLRVLDSGGHHAHVTDPARWLAAVLPWLRER